MIRARFLLAALGLGVGACADSPTSRLHELRRFEAAEARQAVAVDARHFYAIDDRAIGKYDKRTGERVGQYVDPEGGGIHHLNSGIVLDGRLYCAHSNYPGVPMRSSIEIFDAESLDHVGSQNLGTPPGSATWVDRRAGQWWVAFANYAGRGGAPGRGPESTALIAFDEHWRTVERYRFPEVVVRRFGSRSNSGGAFGPDDLLYATGHDAPELYALRISAVAASVELTEVLRVPAEGQGIAWDPSDPRLLYSIIRSSREVVVSRLIERPEAGR